MVKENLVYCNINDDFWDDGCVPKGEKQSTYAYVESDEKLTEQKEILELLCSYINTNKLLPEGICHVEFYDSKIVYPNLPPECHHFQRWKLIIDEITHKKLEKMLPILIKSNLKYKNKPIHFYSES